MTEYSYISFRAPVQNPQSAFRGNKTEVMLSHDTNGIRKLHISREGEVVTLKDPASERIIEVPFSQVKFAEVAAAPTLKPRRAA